MSKRKNKTFAELSKQINRKYKGREYDPISQKTLDIEMNKLVQLNEMARMNKEISTQMANGGDIDDTLLAAQRYQESRFNPNAVSSAGAKGIAQFMPQTWEGLQQQGVLPQEAKPEDPIHSMNAQRFLMNHLYKRFGDTEKALAAYNWGEGNLNKALRKYGDTWKDHLPSETSDYITKVLEYQKQGVSDEGLYDIKPLYSPGTLPVAKPQGSSGTYQTPLEMKYGGYHKSNYRLASGGPVASRAGYFLANYNNISSPTPHTRLDLLSDVIGTATPVNPKSGIFSVLGNVINNTPLINPLNSATPRTKSQINPPAQMGPFDTSALYARGPAPPEEEDEPDPFDTAAYLRDNNIPLISTKEKEEAIQKALLEKEKEKKQRKPGILDGMTPGDKMQLASYIPSVAYNTFQSFKPAQQFSPIRNEMAGQALGQLDQLKINMQPMINEANLSFNAARRQLGNQMGGGALAANLANLTSNTQRNLGTIRLQEQLANNQLKTQAASARLDVGEQDRMATERARQLNIASETTKQQFAAAAATGAGEGLNQTGQAMNTARLNKIITSLAKSANFYYNAETGTIDFEKYSKEHPEEWDAVVKQFGGNEDAAKIFLENKEKFR